MQKMITTINNIDSAETQYYTMVVFSSDEYDLEIKRLYIHHLELTDTDILVFMSDNRVIRLKITDTAAISIVRIKDKD